MFPGFADRMQKEIKALAPSEKEFELLLHLTENILRGLAVQFLVHYQHFKQCGFQDRNMMNPVHPLYIENVYHNKNMY